MTYMLLFLTILFMNKEEFYQYILDNFTIDGTSARLIRSILDFVKNNYTDEIEQYKVLCELLDGTIGLTDEEIKKEYM